MKTSFLLATVLTATSLSLEAGSEYLVKQRAKDLRDQNNERQGVATEQPPSAAAPQSTVRTQPAVVPYAAQPSAPALSAQARRISDSLESLGAEDPASDTTKEGLTDSLTSAVTGPIKPSASKLNRLSRDLTIALEGKALGAASRTQIAGHLEQVLNETLNAKEMDAVTEKVIGLLRENGVGKVDATVVSNDIKSIIAERQKQSKN